MMDPFLKHLDWLSLEGEISLPESITGGDLFKQEATDQSFTFAHQELLPSSAGTSEAAMAAYFKTEELNLPGCSSSTSTSGLGSPIQREGLALPASFARVGDVPLSSDADGMEGPSAASVVEEPSATSAAGEPSATSAALVGEYPSRWSKEEQLVFVGAVFLVFGTRGSLFPTRRKGLGRTAYARQCESETFESVHAIYEASLRSFGFARNGRGIRSAKAICRRFKFLKKVFIRDAVESGEGGLGLLPLVEDWMDTIGTHMVDGLPAMSLTRRRRNGWTSTEEIFLVGSAMLRFFIYGSLCTKRGPTNSTCWEEVKRFYDFQFSARSMTCPEDRSAEDLKMYYKKLKQVANQKSKEHGLLPYVLYFFNLGGYHLVSETGNRLGYLRAREYRGLCNAS